MSMNKEKKITFLSISLSFVILVGVSFAFFYYQRVSNKNVTLITGEIYLHLNDGTDSLTLTNAFPETVEEARAREDNVLTFTIDGKNTTTNKDIWYEIDLVEGDTETGRTRINPQYIKFDLIEVENGVETMVVNAKSFADLNSRKIHVNSVNSVNRNTTTEIVRTYKLRAWFSDSILISDSDESATYTTNELLTTWNTNGQTPTVLTSSDYKMNYEDVITESGTNYFLGLKLNSNNEITNAYACGVYNGNPFCIEGDNLGTNYTMNKKYLEKIYGEYDETENTGCFARQERTYEAFYCGNYSNAISNGYVSVGMCRVGSNGEIGCGVQQVG